MGGIKGNKVGQKSKNSSPCSAHNRKSSDISRPGRRRSCQQGSLFRTMRSVAGNQLRKYGLLVDECPVGQRGQGGSLGRLLSKDLKFGMRVLKWRFHMSLLCVGNVGVCCTETLLQARCLEKAEICQRNGQKQGVKLQTTKGRTCRTTLCAKSRTRLAIPGKGP